MFAILIAAAAGSLSPTATITGPKRINIDGVRATYTRRVDPDGTVHLKGRYRHAEDLRFHYRVRGNQVVGEVGGSKVRFQVPL